jgi:hypothetical protein
MTSKPVVRLHLGCALVLVAASCASGAPKQEAGAVATADAAANSPPDSSCCDASGAASPDGAADAPTQVTGSPDASRADRASETAADAVVSSTTIPAEAPFPRSTSIRSIRIGPRHKEYMLSDTWYLTCATPDTCYSPFMDGNGAQGAWPDDIIMGFATVKGDDPMNLAIATNVIHAVARPFNYRYATTILAMNGVIYYGSSYREPVGGWHLLRPFAGFNISQDGGKTFAERNGPLFAEGTYPDIKMGEPHFVDFGIAKPVAPDGYAYLVGHGHAANNSKPPDRNPHWMWGDAIYLSRVKPSLTAMNDASQYEHFAGLDPQGRPVWSSDFARISPLVQWNNRMGGVTVTYHPGLHKYLMVVTDGQTYSETYNSFFLEAEALTGPWHIVDYWPAFGEQAYFLNIPSKFMSATAEPDGWHMWLGYSANFNGSVRSNPPGSGYHWSLREIVVSVP